MKNPALVAVVCVALVCILAPLPSSAQETDNAALLYWQAIYAADPPDRHQKEVLYPPSSKPFDEAAADEMIRRWHYSLDTLKRAAEKPTCNWGLDFDEGPGLRVTYLGRLQELAGALRLRARLRLRRGEIDGATDDLITMLRFSRHVGEPPWIIAWYTQIVIQGIAVQTVADNLPKFPDAALARLAATLRTLPPGRTLSELLRTEKRSTADWMNRMVDQSLQKHESEEQAEWYQALLHPMIILEPETAEAFHPTSMEEAVRAVRALPQDYDELIRRAEIPYPQSWAALREFAERAQAGKTASPLAATMIPACEPIARKGAEYQTTQAMLLAAIEARLSHGGREALAQSHDPYNDGAPFEVREVDGGLELRSKLTARDKPVTLRVAW